MVQSFSPATKKRFRPYLPVTTLANLMAQENPCLYAAWLKTRYQLNTPPSSFDNSIHDQMVNQRAKELQEQGYSVSIEQENSQKVIGKTFDICIVGRPDIIAQKDDQIIVEDCKSGQKRPSHYYQVLLYLLLLPHASTTKDKCKERQKSGRLIYPDGIDEVPATLMDDDFIALLHKTLKILTSDEIPRANANEWNCRYCALTRLYCSIGRCD